MICLDAASLQGQQLYASLATSWRDRSQRLRIRLGDMWKKKNMADYQERPLGLAGRKPTSKPYRNLPDNVFVIADEDEDTGGVCVCACTRIMLMHSL